MKKFFSAVVCSVLLSCLMSWAAEAGDLGEAETLVEKAVAFYKTSGRQKALEEFSRSNGFFTEGELYIFAYNLKGGIIAHGGDPGLVGKNFIDVQDADGRYFAREFVKTGPEGSWVDYKWMDYATNRVESKRSYLKRVDDVIIGCGAYGSPFSAEDRQTKKSDLEKDIGNMLAEYIKSYNNKKLEGTLASFDPNGVPVAVGTGVDESRFGYDEIKSQLERDFTQSDTIDLRLGNTRIDSHKDVAWIYADAVAKVRAGNDEETIKMRSTFVAVKKQEKWLIVQTHFSIPSTGQKAGESFPVK